MKSLFSPMTAVAAASILILASCTQAEAAKPAPTPTAWESLTAISLPINFDALTAAPDNVTSTAGYLNTYASALEVAPEAPTVNADNHRLWDYLAQTGGGDSDWVAAGSWTLGAKNLGFEIATDADSGRVVLSFKKVNLGSLTATSGLSFDLALPVTNAGFMVYLKEVDSTGTVTTSYAAKLNGGFSASDDWNWWFANADHWNSYKLPLTLLTTGDNGTGTTAASVATTKTFNQIDFVFRLVPGNGIELNTVEKGFFDNLSVY